MDFNTLRPFLSRIIASLVTVLITWLLSKGIDLGADAQGHLTEAGTALAIGGFTLIYGLIHRSIDKKVNPGDAASSHLAAVEKDQSAAIKSAEKADNGSPVGMPSPEFRRHVAGGDPDQDAKGRL